MSPVAVVADSTLYLPPAMAAANDIKVVSLYVNEDGRTWRESDLADYAAFYDRLRLASALPTTSQPSIGDFLAIYEPIVQAGRDVVSVHLAGGISGTVEAARQAAEETMAAHAGRVVEVIDSRVSCGALGYAALAGAAAARGGGTVGTVAERVRRAAQTVRLWFAIDTLEYLRRGGRIGSAAAWVGGALKIKPILTLDGEITPVERVRTAGRAFERLVEYLQSQAADGAEAWIVQHIQAPDVAARLVEAGEGIFGRPPLFVSEIGPVIGAHVGPGLVGVGGGPLALVEP